MGYKQDKADGKTKIIQTRPAREAAPEVAAVPAVINGGGKVTTAAVPAVAAVPAQSAAFRIEIARTPTEHNLTLEQAEQDYLDAKERYDDLLKA